MNLNRSLNSDYKGSGFDRGHLAAAGNHKAHQLHCEQTFYLTNMAPQVGSGFNRDSWNDLEKYVRKLTKQYANVYVCTGPLYLPRKEADGKTYVKYQVIGANSVAVPTHFYKVIVGETSDGRYELESYVMPNQKIADNTPLNVFQVTIMTIALQTILFQFFSIKHPLHVYRCHPNRLSEQLVCCSSIKYLGNNCIELMAKKSNFVTENDVVAA